ncbi:MAG: type I-B CRISPR-associated protein Cas7/Cst2/DevR, partial [Candidatus Aenigmatarchaeota archaeon]
MKVVQISILARVYGNVNADETVGNRITIKKMYDGEGNIYPFISARAIKFAIRKRLEEKGFKIDPFYLQNNMLEDSGKPWEYVDNDLFGYMKPNERKRRTAPVAISYFKALRNTTISTEFGARFPRQEGTNPAPFEIEVADIIGKLNVLIYDYIGRESVLDNEKWEAPINEDERKKRIKALLEILLIERFVLPKRTNSLNIPEYYYALLVQSEKGPLPIYQYL